MKASYLILTCIFSLFFVNAQELEQANPPNTLRLENNLYIDKSPVTNLMYLEFIYSVGNLWNLQLHDTLKTKLPFKISEHLFEKNLKTEASSYLKKYVEPSKTIKIHDNLDSDIYLRHPDLRYESVLNITKKQAELFCLWRSDMVNMIRNKKASNPEKVFYVKYRLPTNDELSEAVLYFKSKDKFSTSGNVTKYESDNINNDVFTVFKISEFTKNQKAFEYTSNWKNK